MEGDAGSEGVIKKKTPSGCLIVKSNGTNIDERRRAGLVAGSSSSSDEEQSLEFMRRKLNEKRMKNGSPGYKKNQTGDHGLNNVGGCCEKKSSLDMFEFDEYDEFNESMPNRFSRCASKKAEHGGSGRLKESGVCSSKKEVVVYKRKGGSSRGRGKGFQTSAPERGDFELNDDDSDMPISSLRLKYQRTGREPIRLQGKNGVLKVKTGKRSDSCDDKEGSSRRVGIVQNDSVARATDHPDLKQSRSQVHEGERNVTKLGKRKPFFDRETICSDSETDDSGTMLELSVQVSRSKKEMGKRSQYEHSTPAKIKEGKQGKSKRGGSTEKQKLRDQIQGMLVGAGWTIDYRPRRNRDYLDAVYINPSGTAYWSVVKAYDALKKQLEEESSENNADVSSATFVPLSDELINKLTRHTRKKFGDLSTRNRKEDSISLSGKICAGDVSSGSDQDEGQLSCYVKQNDKSPTSKRCKTDVFYNNQEVIRTKPCKRPVEIPLKASSSSVQERASKFFGRCTLLVRGSEHGKDLDSDGYVPYNGKRTVLAWLIDSGRAKLSEKVRYFNQRKTRIMLEGWLTREGIHCGCCSKILTVAKFEVHAGSKLRQPFQNIFMESGESLMQCQQDAWNCQDESLRRDFHVVDVDGDDPNDDTCSVCGDGGDLICCDSCPSTFHQICLGIQTLPSGDWHCPNCSCKLCRSYGSGNDAEEDMAAHKLEECTFCEKKYHKPCCERVHASPTSLSDAFFCGQKCLELHDHLQKILGIKQELEAGFSWSLIQRKDLSDSSRHRFPLAVESNSKLAISLSVMDECFLPIVDRRSGINVIQSVIYNIGSNFSRLNYRGFYTVILESGDEIISAASIRLHGDRIAEMPFIGTRAIYRRQGMCRRLLSAIESELRSLKVRQLIIPAIPEHMNTWTEVFGFHELDDADRKEVKFLKMLVFPGIDMLQKKLLKQEASDWSTMYDSVKDHSQLPFLDKESHSVSPLELSRLERIASGGFHESVIRSNADAMDSEFPMPAFPVDHTEADCVQDATKISVCDLPCQEKDEGKPQMENEEKDSFFSSNTINYSSDSDPSPVAAVIDESGSIQDRLTTECSVKVEENSHFPVKNSDDVPAVTSNDNVLGLLPDSAPEHEKTEDKVNGELCP